MRAHLSPINSLARRIAARRALPVCAMLAMALGAATSVQQTPIPVRQVEPAIATAKEPLGLHLGVKQLSDGRVLFSDAQNYRLLLFDSTLTTFKVLADTFGTGTFDYGKSRAQLIGYPGDSSLFVDYASKSLLVLDATGKVARVTALPKTTDILRITSARAMTDARGRLIYRGTYPPERKPLPTTPGVYLTQDRDSAPLVRADFETRTVDTIGALKLPVLQTTERTVSADGTTHTRIIMNPLAWADDWIVTSDGSVAIVRGHDYHVDWVRADNSTASSPKMLFDWLRITDDVKQHLADSARKVVEDRLAESKARLAASGRQLPPGARGFSGSMNMVDGTSTSIPDDATIGTAPLDAILDYYPPIRAGSLQSDLDGNVWILPATTAHALPGGVVYDVVNRRGELFERVQLPALRSLAGFGRNGAIFMVWRDTASVWHLERTRVKR